MQNKFGNMISVEGLQKKEVEKFPLEKWLKLSNKIEVDNLGVKKEINFIAREENKMTFDSNNGTIAFIDGDGHLYVAPATADRYQALEGAGYKKGSLGVPLSNGEKPSDPALLEEWEKMMQEADEQK